MSSSAQLYCYNMHKTVQSLWFLYILSMFWGFFTLSLIFQGVYHAEKNTEQLSLCYANRSAALFHLGLYNVRALTLFNSLFPSSIVYVSKQGMPMWVGVI